MFRIFVVVAMFVPASIFAGSVDREMERVLDQYLTIHASLTNDSVAGVDAAARSIVEIVEAIQTDDRQVQELGKSLVKAASAIQGKELEAARNEFFELSKPLLAYVYRLYSGEREYLRFYCDMAKKGWIQNSKAVRNPYYGSSMLTCGELIQ